MDGKITRTAHSASQKLVILTNRNARYFVRQDDLTVELSRRAYDFSEKPTSPLAVGFDEWLDFFSTIFACSMDGRAPGYSAKFTTVRFVLHLCDYQTPKVSVEAAFPYITPHGNAEIANRLIGNEGLINPCGNCRTVG
jgi:hypothetical protein